MVYTLRASFGLKTWYNSSHTATPGPCGGEAISWHEVPVALSLDGRVIRGAVDAVFHSRDDQWFLVDFKADRIKPEGVAERTEEYLVQLGLYQAGAEQPLGESPRVIVYYLFPGVPMEINRDRLLDAQGQVEALFSGLSTF